MEDLEGNPLYRAFLTKFRREFEIACKMSYYIAIPHSDSLENIIINQILANSHILMPSKLLKMHYTPLQIGFSDDIEIDGRKLIVKLGKKKPSNKVIVNILAEEVGYNSRNKEYKILLIDQPLVVINSWPMMKNLLSPNSSLRSSIRAGRPQKPLIHHDDCFKYLETISQELTIDLEMKVKRLQSNYMILSHYLDDAAMRIKNLAETYISKYELFLMDKNKSTMCSSVSQAIGLSVESYIVHLLHGKLVATIYNLHEKDDRIILEKLDEIQSSGLTICQLGAQLAFADFVVSEEILYELKRLPSIKSPLAIVSNLIKLVDMISGSLNQSVRFKHLMGDSSCDGGKVSICSDDLIASFVVSLAQAKPINLFSLCKYLEIFGWNSNAKDQAAYYTATFQIVVQYVYNFSNSEPYTNDNQPGESSAIVDIQPNILISEDIASESVTNELSSVSQFNDSLDSRRSIITHSTLSSVSDVARGEWE